VDNSPPDFNRNLLDNSPNVNNTSKCGRYLHKAWKLECLHNKHSQVRLPHDIKIRLKTKQILKLLKKIQLEFKHENEAKKQDADL